MQWVKICFEGAAKFDAMAARLHSLADYYSQVSNKRAGSIKWSG